MCLPRRRRIGHIRDRIGADARKPQLCSVFGEPKSEWYRTPEPAREDATTFRLALWDASEKQWFIAMSVEIEWREGKASVPTAHGELAAGATQSGRDQACIKYEGSVKKW